MRSLAVDRVAAIVVATVRDAGLDPVLLKGATLADWLYGAGSEARGYGDVDVLVDPARYGAAEAALQQAGFEPAEPAEWGTSERQPHARAWLRRSDAALVDLHRSLPGLRDVAPEVVWRVLQRHRDVQRLGGSEVAVLDVPARLVLVVLHLRHHALYEHHERATDKAQRDLRRAIEVATDQEWSAARALADELGGTAAFAEGLRTDPAGARLADRLRTISPDLLERVGPGSSTPLLIGFQRLAQTRGLRAKVRLALREIVPPRGQMRYDSRTARRGGAAGLGWAYARRIGHVVRYAIPSYRAWRRMQRPGP